MACTTGKTRGTCQPGCEMYGVCHCGCGTRTTISRVRSGERQTVKGEPYIYRTAHGPTHATRTFSFEERSLAGRLHGRRTGVPMSELAYEIAALQAEFPNPSQLGTFLGLGAGTCYNWVKRDSRYVTQETAAAIRRGFRKLGTPQGRVPSEPLRLFLMQHGVTLQSLGKTWEKRIQRGAISLTHADEMATSLGLHPSDVWGEAWWAA